MHIRSLELILMHALATLRRSLISAFLLKPGVSPKMVRLMM